MCVGVLFGIQSVFFFIRWYSRTPINHTQIPSIRLDNKCIGCFSYLIWKCGNFSLWVYFVCNYLFHLWTLHGARSCVCVFSKLNIVFLCELARRHKINENWRYEAAAATTKNSEINVHIRWCLIFFYLKFFWKEYLFVFSPSLIQHRLQVNSLPKRSEKYQKKEK